MWNLDLKMEKDMNVKGGLFVETRGRGGGKVLLNVVKYTICMDENVIMKPSKIINKKVEREREDMKK
jgi:hypothetical protein